MTTTTMNAPTIHPFEKSGLGKAPFRYIGMKCQEIAYGEAVIGSVGGVMMTTKPGGTCDHCGAYIINMFRIESADGQQSIVGCDCVQKVDTKLAKVVGEDVKKMKKQRDVNRIKAARANLPAAYSLKNEPHPTLYAAQQGRTAWDYASWLLSNAGTAGKLRAARMVEASIAPRVDD